MTDQIHTQIHGVAMPEQIWLEGEKHSGDIGWSNDAPVDDGETEFVAYIRLDVHDAEVKESDAQAGKLQRMYDRLREQEIKRDRWLDEAKRQAGYESNISFDRVWEEAFAALQRERAQPPAIDEMPVMDHGMAGAPLAAFKVVKEYDPGRHGLIENLSRLSNWLQQYRAKARKIGGGNGNSADS